MTRKLVVQIHDFSLNGDASVAQWGWNGSMGYFVVDGQNIPAPVGQNVGAGSAHDVAYLFSRSIQGAQLANGATVHATDYDGVIAIAYVSDANTPSVSFGGLNGMPEEHVFTTTVIDANYVAPTDGHYDAVNANARVMAAFAMAAGLVRAIKR